MLRRNLNDWVVDTLVEMYRILGEFKGIKQGPDKIWWNVGSTGSLRVSSAHKLLNTDLPDVLKALAVQFRGEK